MVFQAFEKVFRRPGYLLLALIMSLTVFVFAIWLPNLRLLGSFFQSEATLAEKLQLALALLGSIGSNFSLLSASYTIVIAVLFGIYVALLAYFIRQRVAGISQRNLVAGGISGMVSGLFGIGCAACGSLILTIVLGWASAAAILAHLPLRGREFGLLGIAFLALVIYFTARRIQSPGVCKLNE